MKLYPFLLAVMAVMLFGCAGPKQRSVEQEAFVGGCYNPVPSFERLVAQRATREQVEARFHDAQRVSTEKALRAAARSPITPANLVLFRRYHSATLSFMDCDNQVVAFFDDTGHLVAFQAM